MPRPLALLLARQQALHEEIKEAHESEVSELRQEVAQMKQELEQLQRRPRRSSGSTVETDRPSPIAKTWAKMSLPIGRGSTSLLQKSAENTARRRLSLPGFPADTAPAPAPVDAKVTAPAPPPEAVLKVLCTDTGSTVALDTTWPSATPSPERSLTAPTTLPVGRRRGSRMSQASRASLTLPNSLAPPLPSHQVSEADESADGEGGGSRPSAARSRTSSMLNSSMPNSPTGEPGAVLGDIGRAMSNLSADSICERSLCERSLSPSRTAPAILRNSQPRASITSAQSLHATWSLSHRHSQTLITVSQRQALSPWAVWEELANQSDEEDLGIDSDSARNLRQNAIDKLRRHGKSSDFHNIDLPTTRLGWAVQAMVMHPTSIVHIASVCIGMIFIIYDIIVVPLFVFELPELEDPTLVISGIVSAFWTTDFILNFFIGYYSRGLCEMRFRKTARRYASTWMPLDLVLLTADWVTFFALNEQGPQKQSTSAARITRSVRVMRTLRSVSLIKALVRFGRLPLNFKDLVSSLGRSQLSSMVFEITKYMLGILIVNHAIACFWVELGKETPCGWVQYYVYDMRMPDGEDWRMQYLTALQWSLSQFTPTKMEVDPRTLPERFFAVAVLIFAMVVFSSFLSSISTAMTQIRTLKMEETKNFLKLERFLQDNRISLYLSARIRRYLDYFLADQKKHPAESSVTMLQHLSEPLLMELHFEVYSSWLMQHPFFAVYSAVNRIGMNRLCHKAMKMVCLTKEDTLFGKGDAAKYMYFVVRGTLMYTYCDDRTIRRVGPGEWACEMVLWTPWEYQGFMRASGDVHLIALDAAAFHEVILDSKGARREVAEYATQAVKYLNLNQRSKIMSDLNGDAYNPEDIVQDVFPFEDRDSVSEERTHLGKMRSLLSLDSKKSRKS